MRSCLSGLPHGLVGLSADERRNLEVFFTVGEVLMTGVVLAPGHGLLAQRGAGAQIGRFLELVLGGIGTVSPLRIGYK